MYLAGSKTQTVGHTSQNAGDEGQMHRGLLEPLGTLVLLPGDAGPTFVGWCQKCRGISEVHSGENQPAEYTSQTAGAGARCAGA